VTRDAVTILRRVKRRTDAILNRWLDRPPFAQPWSLAGLRGWPLCVREASPITRASEHSPPVSIRACAREVVGDDAALVDAAGSGALGVGDGDVLAA